ncbi:hypothetical protein MNBD_GAMMA16-90 [hydrothermal vent metagenome]|uniref:Methyltransferase domain-containing protein n=1 Tax=hydrothermal vent metagenome TaxID=652676 RepID=A0A3B0ZC21_9ZZZZ
MERIPEEELMTEPAHVQAYANADFSEPHNAFVTQFGEQFSGFFEAFDVLDLGCGAADISLRFARAYPACRLVGIDGSEVMLTLGRECIRQAGLQDRIRLSKRLLPVVKADSIFDVIISNSLLHHLVNPAVLWQAVQQFGKSGSKIFIMDLLRPDSQRQAETLVNKYAKHEHPLLKKDFFNSLCAAYRVNEVQGQLERAGLSTLSVSSTSDRHLVVTGCLP